MSRNRYFIVGLACVVAVLALEVNGLISSADDDPRYREAQQLLAGIPAYPGSKEVSSSGKSVWWRASVGKSWEADVGYADLKGFYVGELTRSGWGLVQERELRGWLGRDTGRHELTFRRGEDTLFIEYAGRRANYGWDYSVSLRH